MTERERENLGLALSSGQRVTERAPDITALGLELASWLHAVVAGAPGFSGVRLVNDAGSVVIEPRWDGLDAITLVVRVRGRDEMGRVIGRGGTVVEPALRPLTRRVGLRLGLRVGIEVVEA